MPPSTFFTPRTLAGNAFPPLINPEVALVWLAYRELDRTQWLDPPTLERQQMGQVRLLLEHCQANVPFYAEMLKTAGVQPNDIQSMPDFRKLPLLARQTYQEQYPSFCARSLPPGTKATNTAKTSGTSGVPIQVQQTNVVGLWWLAFFLRDLEWCGLDPRNKLASIRTMTLAPQLQQQFRNGLTLPHWHPQLAKLIETGPSHGMDLHQDPRRQLAWLREVAPDYLLSYPSNLDYLASLLREEGKPIPNLKMIQTFAETLSTEMRARIQSAFGVPVKNLYSCVEAGYLASPCPQGHGLHVHAENVILEILDDEGQPCPPGETGRVVLTTLHNFQTPFIRYEILDEATPGPEGCPCGRSLPRLARVDGKFRPMLHLPDGRRKSSRAIIEALGRLDGIRQQQVIQRAADHLIVRIAPGPGWKPEYIGQVRKAVKEFFETEIHCDVETPERLELPAGGKLREVVSEVAESATSGGA